MKKLFYLLLLFCVSLSFAACGGDDEEEKKEEEKPFEWKGDWNDTTDPEYPKFDVEKYPNGYNPIVGEWVGTHYEGIHFIYGEDFSIKRRVFNAKVGGWELEVIADKYMINDTGIKYFRNGGYNMTTEEYKFAIEDGVIYLYNRYLNDKWYKYKRLAE